MCFRGELGFLNYDDICMYVVNNQFEFFEFVFNFIYVDLQYDEIYLVPPTGGGIVMSSDLQIVISSLQTVSSTVFLTRVSLQRLS